MQHQWAEDYQEQWKLLENAVYLLASFDHPDTIKRILGKGNKSFASTDEEFDKTMEMIKNLPPIQSSNSDVLPKRRRRRINK